MKRTTRSQILVKAAPNLLGILCLWMGLAGILNYLLVPPFIAGLKEAAQYQVESGFFGWLIRDDLGHVQFSRITLLASLLLPTPWLNISLATLASLGYASFHFFTRRPWPKVALFFGFALIVAAHGLRVWAGIVTETPLKLWGSDFFRIGVQIGLFGIFFKLLKYYEIKNK